MSAEFSLSGVEKQQLGKPKTGSSIEYIKSSEWQILREEILAQSLKRNPLLDSEMVAYTPGETLVLLKKPEVILWHKNIVNFSVPDKHKQIILVPCAKTKPWDKEHSKRSVSYRSYHEILDLSVKGEIPPVYFVTISEPLGVVPQDFWASFPQYDNPGLFKEDYLRTGMYKNDWIEKFGVRRQLPFDKNAYQESINILGHIISKFLRNNYRGRKILSFVDSLDGTTTTHSDMLNVALQELDGEKVDLQRFSKKRKPREAPLQHILSKITME